MRPSIISIGECMLELAKDGAGRWQLGHAGDTFNTSLYLCRLGLNVGYLTALGTDPFSEEMRCEWKREGLDTSLVLTDPKRLPGLYAIRTDRFGERNFFYWRQTSAVRRLFTLAGIDAALDTAREARLLYLSGITLSLFDEDGIARLLEVCAAVRSRGGQIAFDPNYRPAGWESPASARAIMKSLAPLVTIALPTFDDEAALHGDRTPDATIERWHRHGAGEVVVKLGSRGSLISNRGMITSVQANAHVLATDTTGAGDAFNAGYLAARWYGASIIAAGTYANRLAGEVVRHPGAIMPLEHMPSLPIPAEILGDCA
jgi:2-dehydro-3-deoxygluconokinase